MQTASIFLLPNGTFFVELAVFAIILFLIGKYILPPLNRAMARRQEEIRSSLESADRARADAQAADDERRSALEAGRSQAREVVAQANRTADQVRADAQESARAEYERIVSSAQLEVDLARRRALEAAAAQMGEMVLEVVERIIGREVDADAHRDLIDEAISAVSAETGSGGAAAAGAGTRS